MASVTLSRIKKRFGAAEVIKGIDLDIADGEFTVLVGPSGCGKSTLLRMIAGLETVTEGRIDIGDRDVTEREPKDRDIAMVFQNYALYPHMTVATNMGFSLEHRGAPKAEIAERVQWAAGILGLTPYLERYPRQLSGGQRQRVAMGRAIVRDPKVFLFDEPLSNLDAKMRVMMRAEIKALHQRLGTTMIYVTHDQIEAMTMADRVVVMNTGVVEQIGAPLDLYDHPANLFVAEFIGSPAMNLIPGTLTDGDGFAFGDAGDIPMPGLSRYAGEDVVLGIRPEHVEVGQGPVAARVEIVEPLGAQTQISFRTGDLTLHAMIQGRFTGGSGQEIRLGFQPGSAHLFARSTGQRLS